VAPEDKTLLADVLTQQVGYKVGIHDKVRTQRNRWLELALTNARKALGVHLASQAGMRQRLESLQDALGLDSLPDRMECFDISHTMGEATVASCVVFGSEGPLKQDYRRFNIESITPGDDYGAMRQALTRRYRRLKDGEAKLPDVLFIDGGKGQVGCALEVLEELQIAGVNVVGITKGAGRRPDLDTLYIAREGKTLALPHDSPGLHLVQQMRDEAHRFAITAHRQRRGKQRSQSPLEQISGLGPRRRKVLLSHFGGLKEVARAGVDDLAKVPGISRQLAQRIYDYFHLEDNVS
jgi:excinuclease ABC subunit C